MPIALDDERVLRSRACAQIVRADITCDCARRERIVRPSPERIVHRQTLTCYAPAVGAYFDRRAAIAQVEFTPLVRVRGAPSLGAPEAGAVRRFLPPLSMRFVSLAARCFAANSPSDSTPCDGVTRDKRADRKGQVGR